MYEPDPEAVTLPPSTERAINWRSPLERRRPDLETPETEGKPVTATRAKW
jgi:hypothetical protein